MKLSVTVPVYNETRNIAPFYERIKPVLESIDGVREWEIVFVNNGSEDRTLQEILDFRKRDARVKVVTLSRNFGYQSALIAGLSYGVADLFAAIDVDCEDPPELLIKFYDAIRSGAQIAYGIRSDRDEPAIITICRKAFYYLNKMVADSEIIVWMSEFCMMTRQVKEAILAAKTTYPFLRAEICYVGFTRVGIAYRRAARLHGGSHYNLFGMIRFAIGGVLSSSTFPLRLVLYLSVFLALAYPIGVIIFGISTDQAVKLAVILAFYFLLISIPALALYLARTYKNGVARPIFVVDEAQTFL